MSEFMPETEEPAGERGVDRVLAIFEDLYEAVVDDIAARTEVVKVRRYGVHELTRFRDGRVQCLSRPRWEGDRDQCGPTPYELLQLGEDPRPLYPVPLSTWQVIGGLLPALVASTLPLFGWGARGRSGRRRWTR